MKKLFFLICMACTVFVSCQNHSQDSKNAAMDMAAAEPPPAAAPAMKMEVAQSNNAQPNTQQTTTKKIVKEGEISLETGNLKNSRKALLDTLQRLGGYVDEESETNNGDFGRKEYLFKIRIPVQNFDTFLSSVSSTADRTESKSIRIRDVTTEYIDITTRLNNKTLLEKRYKELLQKSTKMADVLEVESKLNDIRTDIEASQGQLNYLNKQIAYSSLEVTFFTKNAQDKNDGNGFGYQLKNALSDGWESLHFVFFGLISLWPYVFLFVLIYWLYRKWRKRRNNRPL